MPKSTAWTEDEDLVILEALTDPSLSERKWVAAVEPLLPNRTPSAMKGRAAVVRHKINGTVPQDYGPYCYAESDDLGPNIPLGDRPLDVPKKPCSRCRRMFQPTRKRRMLCANCFSHGERVADAHGTVFG